MKIKYTLAIVALLASAGVAEARGTNDNANQGSRTGINAKTNANANASFNRFEPASGNRYVRTQTRANTEGMNHRAYSIRNLDRNDDNLISQSEFNASTMAQSSRFEQLDINADGQLSSTELNNFNNLTFGNVKSNYNVGSNAANNRADSRVEGSFWK